MRTAWLDGKNVVFGSVVEGLDVIKNIESLGSTSGSPSKLVQIADCGQLNRTLGSKGIDSERSPLFLRV
jgi:cyclophilin family peptidyl-prolyl cis-trans isomerase